MILGKDDNHTELYLDDRKEYDLNLYTYSRMRGLLYEFWAELQLVQLDCEQMYYDLRVSIEILEFSKPNTKGYWSIMFKCLRCLWSFIEIRIPMQTREKCLLFQQEALLVNMDDRFRKMFYTL